MTTPSGTPGADPSRWLVAMVVVAIILSGAALTATLLVYLRLQEMTDSSRAEAGQNSARFDDLDSRLEELDGETGGLAGDVEGLRGSLDSLTSDLGSVTTDLDTLSGDLSTLAGGQFDAQTVAARALESVVTVGCGPFFGSGFAFDVPLPEDYETAVLTNHHVVRECTMGAVDPTVARGGEELTGALVAWDADSDIALILVRELIPALSGGPEPSVGDAVMTIGSPHGFEGTVSTGVVSNLLPGAFTTDAGIDPGNSGGPVLNRAGEVIGIATLEHRTAEALNVAVGITEACRTILTCEEG